MSTTTPSVIDTVTPSGWRVSTSEFVQHGHAVLELFEHGGFPVMVHDGGYPRLVNTDGRGTSPDKGAAHHIAIGLYGSETRYGDGRVVRAWRKAAMRAASEAADREAAANPPPRRAWGARGVRYDEACEHCRKVRDVDNDTGLCQKCAG